MNNYTSSFHPLADKEYIEAIKFYENKVIGLGAEFIFEVETVIDLIEERPRLFQIKKAKKREAIVDRFPYLIVYEIVEAKKHLHIISVFNTSRDPKLKKR